MATIKRIDQSVLMKRKGSEREVVEILVGEGANLTGADLTGANLTGANLTRADLTRANLTRANLWGANLWGTNLWGAYLTRADLTGAYLTRANLTGAYLTGAYFDFKGEKIEIIKKPLQIDTEYYDVIIFDNIMKIGCEMHSTEDWFNFDNKIIAEMDGKQALKFWKQWKKPLKAICKNR